MMKNDENDANMNKDQKLQQIENRIENNQRKIIEQNNKIISLLEKINSSLRILVPKPWFKKIELKK